MNKKGTVFLMMKRILAVLMSVIISLSVITLVSAAVTDEVTVADVGFMINTTASSAPAIAGNTTEGFTSILPSGATTGIMPKTEFALSRMFFDLSIQCNATSVGHFGISKADTLAEAFPKTGADKISFTYRTSGGSTLNVYLVDKNGSEIHIGSVPAVGNDLLWNIYILQVGFAKSGLHWYLSVNGTLCKNIPANIETAQLEQYFGTVFFENAEKGYFFYGATAVGGAVKSYFKPTKTVGDSWDAVSENRYFSPNYSGQVYEWRGSAFNSNTVFSSAPEVTGDRTEGHIVDFSETQGYVQSAMGFDLKNTTFDIAPFKDSIDDFPNEFYYSLAFTTNPSHLKGKIPNDAIAKEILEFAFQAYSPKVTNNTYFYPVTQGGSKPISTGVISTGGYHSLRDTDSKGSTYYKTAPVTLSFKKAKGYKGEMHWYMHVTIFGSTKVVCNTSDEESDKSLRFDDIIDKRIYARFGTYGKSSYGGKMYIKASEWPESQDGFTNLTPEEIKQVDDINSRIEAITEINDNNYQEIAQTLKAIREDCDALSDTVKIYVDVDALKSKEDRVAVINNRYNPGDWYVVDMVATYTGDQYINYQFSNAYYKGTVNATTSGDYDITKNSLYWKGIQIPSGNWFAYGLTTDMTSDLLPNGENGKSVTFVLTPEGNTLILQLWDPSQNKVVQMSEDGSSLLKYEAFEYYNRQKDHYFQVVKQDDGHWYLKVDDVIFDQRSFDFLDAYMEANATKSKIRFAGNGGLSDCTVNIIDRSVDDSIVPDDIKATVEDFDSRVFAVGGIKSITDNNLAAKKETVNKLKAEYDSFNSRIQKYISSKEELDGLLTRISLMENSASTGEWSTNKSDFTYTKIDENLWKFDKVEDYDSRFATTTTPYKAVEKAITWSPYIRTSHWFCFGLSADYTISHPLNGTAKSNILIVCFPQGADLAVMYFDCDKQTGLNLEPNNVVARYQGYNMYNRNMPHTFGITKGNDGHYYFYIDDKLFNGVHYDQIDEFMEKYGDSAYLTIGSHTGTDETNVEIIDATFKDTTLIVDSTTIKGELSPAQAYLQILEENFIKVWEHDSVVTKKVFDSWNKLSYREQLEVEGILFSDEYLWEINDLVATYDPALYVKSAPLPDSNNGNTGADGSSPSTGDNSRVEAAIIIFTISAFGCLVILKQRKLLIKL